MNPDLCDVCGCRGAGGFRGDGLSTQQHPGVYVTVSVDLLKKNTPLMKSHFKMCILDKRKLPTTTDLLSSYQI